MVLRPSSSSWSVSPETIITHHYRLYTGSKHAIDNTPPYSMYNSPKSSHYIPRRCASVEDLSRKQKTQRELDIFVNRRHRFPSNSNLNQPSGKRSSRYDHIPARLLSSQHYRPPQRRTIQTVNDILGDFVVPERRKEQDYVVGRPERRPSSTISRPNRTALLFKDSVFDHIIGRGIFTDSVIQDAVESEMRKWSAQLTQVQLELMSDEIYRDFGVKRRHTRVKRCEKREGEEMNTVEELTDLQQLSDRGGDSLQSASSHSSEDSGHSAGSVGSVGSGSSKGSGGSRSSKGSRRSRSSHASSHSSSTSHSSALSEALSSVSKLSFFD